MKKRGQAATEYIILVGFVFFALIVGTSLLYREGTSGFEDIVASQLMSICLEMTDQAETTYYMGFPARQTMEVNFPEGVRNLTIARNDPISTNCTACTEIRFQLSSTQTERSVICSTPIDIQTDLTPRGYAPGLRRFRFEAQGSYVYLNLTA